MRCCRVLSTQQGDSWDRKAGVYFAEHNAADGAMVVQLTSEDPAVRTGRGHYDIRPVGRPVW